MGDPFSEKVTVKPFGTVQNGSQMLSGLDYTTAMWSGDEENPFHTEVGYWLWDAATDEVLRCFVVPRWIALVAGGTAAADATSFTMHAGGADTPYRIAENTHLAAKASTDRHESHITINPDGSWSYDEVTTLRMVEIDGEFAHTDHNMLVRAG